MCTDGNFLMLNMKKLANWLLVEIVEPWIKFFQFFFYSIHSLFRFTFHENQMKVKRFTTSQRKRRSVRCEMGWKKRPFAPRWLDFSELLPIFCMRFWFSRLSLCTVNDIGENEIMQRANELNEPNVFSN